MQAVVALGLWSLSGSRTLPSPLEVAHAWLDLVQHQGLLFELWASVKVSLVALALSTLAAVAMPCLATAPPFMPRRAPRGDDALPRLRRAHLRVHAGVQRRASALRVAILSFGMFVFMVTALLADLAATSRDPIDHCRTLGMRHWRITGEVVVLGKADVILDLMRQNAAVGWTLLTLVEGLTRSAGGIGAMLLNQNRYFLLAGVFAIQATILAVGLAQDALLSLLKDTVCPWSTLGKETKHAMNATHHLHAGRAPADAGQRLRALRPPHPRRRHRPHRQHPARGPAARPGGVPARARRASASRSCSAASPACSARRRAASASTARTARCSRARWASSRRTTRCSTTAPSGAT